MYIFVECWKSRPEWLTLSQGERSAYMNQLGQGIENLVKSGVEIVTWSFNDPDTSQRSPYDYFAVWEFPTKEMVVQFEEIVRQSGWYSYFEQVNLRGELLPPDPCIGHLINA